jgi:predicted  nucleic acid-binding Zn-ribbon protein
VEQTLKRNDMDKQDKDIKSEIQSLRTEINAYKKCLKSILYDIEHKKTELYDYGAASDAVIEAIKETIHDCNSNVSNIKKQYGQI